MTPLFKLTTDSEVRPTGDTLGELVEWFCTDVLPNPQAGIRRKTGLNYRNTFKLALMWLGDHPSQDEVLKWTLALAAPPHDFGPRTVYHHFKNLRALYRYGSDGTRSQGNPCAFLRLVQPEAAPRPIVNIDAVWPLLMEACETPRERAFLGVMRFAGLRRSEALGVKAGDVLMRTRPWWLHVERQRPTPNRWETTATKTSGSYRSVEVRPELVQLLSDVLDQGEAKVWTGYGGRAVHQVPFLFPFREHELANLARRLREVAPLSFPRGKMWHIFRDTLAVEMDRAGIPVPEISRTLGHSSPVTTQVNYFGRSSMARHVAGVFGKLYEGQAPPGAAAGKSEPSPADTGKGSRRSKAVQPMRESPPCSATTKRSVRSQRSLPGLSVGPVVPKPPRRKP